MSKIRNRKYAGLTLLGNFQSAFPHANPQRDWSVPMDGPECITRFPVTGQPDFAETLEELVQSYNSVRRNIEELMKLSRNLAAEQQRHVRENMTGPGLVIFNILTRPAPELGADERHAAKKVARRLPERIPRKIFRALNP